MQDRPNYTFIPNPWFQNSNWNEFASYTTTSTTIEHIYGSSGLVATHTNDKTIEFPLKDHLGSPRVVLKQDIVNGNVTGLSAIDMYSWHPFGGILQTLGNGEPQYGFTGQEKDYESDLHNFRARQYSDNLGRFFAVDPQGQYHSPYVYGGNNPFSYTDPDGEFAHLIFGAAIGGTINWLANGADFSLKGFGHFAVGAAAGAIGAGFGAGVTNMMAGKAFGAGFIGGTNLVGVGFAGGAGIGAAAGASSGFITGMGNSIVNGNNFSSSFDAGVKGGFIGGVTGVITGGIGGAWNAHKWDRNWFTGAENSPLFSNVATGPVHVDQMSLPNNYSNINLRAAEVAKQFHWEFEAQEIIVYGSRIVEKSSLSLDYNTLNAQFLASVLTLENKKYKLNTKGPDSYDCSGVVCHGIKNVTGKDIHRTADNLYNNYFIPSSQTPSGGMVTFYDWTGNGNIDHVTTFITPNQVLHPSSTSKLILSKPWPFPWLEKTYPNAKIYHGTLNWDKLFKR